MKYIFFLLSTITLLSCECRKIEIYDNYIIAGDISNKNHFQLGQYMFIDPKPTAGALSDFGDYPISYNSNDNFEIRMGHAMITVDCVIVSKSFYLSNNYLNTDNVEFALSEKDTINRYFDQKINMLMIFEEGDSITEKLNWAKSDDIIPYYVSYYYKFDIENISFNKDIEQGYIGIRSKKGNRFLYGWLSVEAHNHDSLWIDNSCFIK